MLQNLSVAMSMAMFPVRALYAGYRALAWAFDAPAPPDAPGAIDVPGTLPPAARQRLLKTGFASSTILWVPLAYLAALAHRAGWVSTPGAWTAFAWSGLVVWVISVLALRRAGRGRIAARDASVLVRARRAVAGAAGAPARAVTGARARFSGLIGRARAVVPGVLRRPGAGAPGPVARDAA